MFYLGVLLRKGNTSLHFTYFHSLLWGFPGSSDVEESACNAGDLGSNRGLERSPEEGNGNPLKYCCLENSMDRGAWQAIVYGVTKNRI